MRKLAKINCLEINNHDNAPWVILFHGFGADAYDLQQLGDVIPTAKPVNWLFPQGIIQVNIGGGFTGRAWWNIDVMALQLAMMRGETRDMSTQVPDGLAAAREQAFDMIRALNVPWNKIILGGFSQGSMLAVDLFFRAPEKPAGLVVLSGTALELPELKPLVEARSGAQFFQSHGVQDQVLGIGGARKLHGFLTGSGLKGKLLEFSGAHEIPPQAIQQAGAYIDMVI